MCFIYAYPSYRCNFPHQPAAFIDYWTPQQDPAFRECCCHCRKTVFGWALWVTKHQQWQNLGFAYNEMLGVIQTYFHASVIWLNIRCFCLLMSNSQRAEMIPQTQLWKLALKAVGLEFPVVIDDIFTSLHSLRVGYQPWCILLFISFHWTLK